MLHDIFGLCLTRHTCGLHKLSTQHAKAALAGGSDAVSAAVTVYMKFRLRR
jgi:hypothetical protein